MIKNFSINERGFSVRCKLYCADERAVSSAVIFGGGFGGNKENKNAAKLADRIQKRHPSAALLIFDWPCHGEDARSKPVLDDCVAYLDLVICYVRSRYHADTLYGTANSFGSFVFLKYIRDRGNPFVRTALRCPAINMNEILTDVIMTPDELNQLKKRKSVLVGFERKIRVTDEFVESLRKEDLLHADFSACAGDMVILHGTKDEIVPLEVAKTFADANGIPFCAVESADHKFTDPAIFDEVIAKIIRFLFDEE